jgi:hypothetical protein
MGKLIMFALLVAFVCGFIGGLLSPGGDDDDGDGGLFIWIDGSE